MRMLGAGRSARLAAVGTAALALLVTACGAPAQEASSPPTTAAPADAAGQGHQPGQTTTPGQITPGQTTPGGQGPQPGQTAGSGQTQPAAGSGSISAPACNEPAVIDSWPLPLRAAQLIAAPVIEDDVGAAQPLVAAGVGGLILFGATAPPTLGSDLQGIEKSSPNRLAPLVMTDEEGGEIQRMANLVGNLPWPRTMAATLSASQVQSLAETTAERMRADGVTMDLAPVVDLSDSAGPNNEFPDGPRSFSLDPTIATRYSLAFAKGLEAGGIIPVVKHFPGLGEATGNTDNEAASVPSLSVLGQAALLPFKAAIAAGLPAVMVSNATITGLTGNVPASLSSAAIGGVLRTQLGFKGLVITDSLNAQSIVDAGYSVPSATVAAIAAGADMVIYDADNPLGVLRQSVQAVVAAVGAGTISTAQLDAAVAQVLATKGLKPCSLPPPATAPPATMPPATTPPTTP